MIQGSAIARHDRDWPPTLGGAEAKVGDLVLQWFDLEEMARLIVDAALTIKWLNASAERELQRRHDILKRGNLLMAVNPAHQMELLALLAGCGDEAQTLCLRSEDRVNHLLVRVQPLSTGTFGLVLRRSGHAFKARYADLGAAFQLTRGEVRVLLQLADGHSASQVADQLKVSTETVRTHIKNLYAKLNVKTREGLLSRLRAYQL